MRTALMILAIISWNSFDPLVVAYVRFNAKDYLNILSNHTMIQILFPDGSRIFRNDHVAISKANVIQNW